MAELKFEQSGSRVWDSILRHVCPIILFIFSVPKAFQLSSVTTIVCCCECLHPIPQSQGRHSQAHGPRAIIRRWDWGENGFGEIEVALVPFQKTHRELMCPSHHGGHSKMQSVDQERPHQTVSANTLIILNLLAHETKKISAEPGMRCTA